MESSGTTSAISSNFGNACNTDQVTPVTLIMVQDDKTIVTKTEFVDSSDDSIAIENAVDEEMQMQVKIEDELSEGVQEFVYSNTDDQSEVIMSEVKSEPEELVGPELSQLPLNVDSIVERDLDFNEHVFSVVRADGNSIELDTGLSLVSAESVNNEKDLLNDTCNMTINVEAPRLYEEIKMEPSILDDLIKTEHCVQAILNSDEIKTEPSDWSVIKSEPCGYSLDLGHDNPYDMVENSSEMYVKPEVEVHETCMLEYPETVNGGLNWGECQEKSDFLVKTEEDDSYLLEYPDTVIEEIKRRENQADSEGSHRISHKKTYQKMVRGNKRLNIHENRPLAHKRRLTVSTKMKDFVSDYVPYTSRKERNIPRKTRNSAKLEGASKTRNSAKLVGACKNQNNGRMNKGEVTISPVADSPGLNKRQTKTTKSKDNDSDYVPDEPKKTLKKLHKTRKVANIASKGNLETSIQTRKQQEEYKDERVPIEHSGGGETSVELGCGEKTEDSKKCHVCRRCGKQCEDFKVLELHFRTEHPGNILQTENQDLPNKSSFCICRRCGKQCKDLKTFELHFKEKHPGKNSKLETRDLPFKCSFCYRQFDTFAYLSTHLLRHKSCAVERSKLSCRFCGRIFRWSTSLKNHLLHHTKEKIHVCKICQKAFSQAGNLRRHVHNHKLRETGERKLKCSKCDRKFLNNDHLKKHMFIHNGFPFLCHICGKTWSDRCYLVRHLATHKKEVQRSKENLQIRPVFHVVNSDSDRHSDTRGEEDQYSKKNKKSHSVGQMKKSSGFVCLWCGKEFFNNDESHRHIFNCDKKPNKKTCSWCLNQFSMEDDYLKHMGECEKKQSNQKKTRDQQKACIGSQNIQDTALDVSEVEPKILQKGNYISILPTNLEDMPMVSRIKAQSKQSDEGLNPKMVPIVKPAPLNQTTSVCTRVNTNSVPYTVPKPIVVSNATSTVLLKPVLIPASNLVITRLTESKATPLKRSIPIVSSRQVPYQAKANGESILVPISHISRAGTVISSVNRLTSTACSPIDLTGEDDETITSVLTGMGTPGPAKTEDPKKCHICRRCGKQCKDYNTMELHFKEEHPGKSGLVEIVEMPHKSSFSICTRCGKQCKDLKTLELHFKEEHSQKHAPELPSDKLIVNFGLNTLQTASHSTNENVNRTIIPAWPFLPPLSP